MSFYCDAFGHSMWFTFALPWMYLPIGGLGVEPRCHVCHRIMWWRAWFWLPEQHRVQSDGSGLGNYVGYHWRCAAYAASRGAFEDATWRAAAAEWAR